MNNQATPTPENNPRPKRLLTPPEGKQRSLALAMTCALMALTLFSVLQQFFSGSTDAAVADMLREPLYIVLSILGLLASLAVYVYFLLPQKGQRRKTLALLLGISLLFSLVITAYALLVGIELGVATAAQAMGEQGASYEGMIRVVTIVIGVCSVLFNIAVSPFFILFIGALRGKSTEKATALISGILLGFGLLSMPISLLSNSLELRALLTSSLPGVAANLCSMVLYLIWPVLTRPILEKETPAE